MEQVAKRVRVEESIESYICPHFDPKDKRLAVYFYVALECDTPILEALLFTTFATTAYKDDHDWDLIVQTLFRLFHDQAKVHYPFHSIQNNNTLHKFKNQETGYWIHLSCARLPVDTQWRTQDVRIVKFANEYPTEEAFCLLADRRNKKIFAVSRQTDLRLRPVKWNSLRSLVEEQIEYLILPPKQTN